MTTALSTLLALPAAALLSATASWVKPASWASRMAVPGSEE